MKRLLFILSVIISGNIFACDCAQIKGLNGKPAGIVTMDSIFQNLFQVRVLSKDSSGIIVSITKDFHNSTDRQTLCIVNSDPGYTCSHSTDDFKIGDSYLITIWPELMEYEYQTLSTCYESFINISNETIKAQIDNDPKLREWTQQEIETELNIELKKD